MLKTLLKSLLFGVVLTAMPLIQAAPQVESGKTHYFGQLTQGRSPQETFDNLIKDYDVVVDFYASWCGPCKQMSPIIDAVARDFKQIIFVKIDVDAFGFLSERYGVRSIPTLLYFKQGRLIKQSTGSTSKAKLAATLASLYQG